MVIWYASLQRDARTGPQTFWEYPPKRHSRLHLHSQSHSRWQSASRLSLSSCLSLSLFAVTHFVLLNPIPILPISWRFQFSAFAFNVCSQIRHALCSHTFKLPMKIHGCHRHSGLLLYTVMLSPIKTSIMQKYNSTPIVKGSWYCDTWNSPQYLGRRSVAWGGFVWNLRTAHGEPGRAQPWKFSKNIPWANFRQKIFSSWNR